MSDRANWMVPRANWVPRNNWVHVNGSTEAEPYTRHPLIRNCRCILGHGDHTRQDYLCSGCMEEVKRISLDIRTRMSTRVTFVPVDGITLADPPTEDEPSRHPLVQGYRYTFGVEGRDSTCTLCLEELKATDVTVTHAKCLNAYHDGCFSEHLASNADLLTKTPVRSKCPNCNGVLYPWPALVGPVFDWSAKLDGCLPPVFADMLGEKQIVPGQPGNWSPWGSAASSIWKDLSLLEGPRAFGMNRARRQAAIDRLVALGDGDADASHAICGRVEHGNRVLESVAAAARTEIAARGKKSKHLLNIVNSVRVLAINRNTVKAFDKRTCRQLIEVFEGWVRDFEHMRNNNLDDVPKIDLRKETCLVDFEDSSNDEVANVDREHGALSDRLSGARWQERCLREALEAINGVLQYPDEDSGDDEDSGYDEEHDDDTPMD
jgi:hypothetical protein